MKLRYFALLATVPWLFSIGPTLAQLGSDSTIALAQTRSVEPDLIAQQPAQPDSPSDRKGPGRRGRMFEQLDLTPEQQTEIKAIRDQSRQDSEGLRQQMRAAHEQMRSLMSSNASDNDLRAQHETIQGLRQQLGTQRFETMLKIRAELTPEQRTKMAELKAQHKGRRHWGRRGAWGQ